LPLLGHCSEVLKQWDDNTPTVVATVTMRLKRKTYKS
jgi:hypothetical protein